MSLSLDRTTWTRASLGDVAAASKERVDPTDGSVERYVAGEHMDTDDLKVHRWGHVADFDLGPAFHRRFRPGQVLYGSRRTYLRKVAVADFDGVCANTTFVVKTKDRNSLLQEFLPFAMMSEPFHAFAIAESKGSVNPYVNWSDIERFEFDLPPLADQERIANLLWAIERTERVSMLLRDGMVDARQTWLDATIAALTKASAVPFARVWARSPEGGWSSPPVDEGTGHFVLSLAALGPEGYRPGNLKNIPDTAKARAAGLRRGDLLVSRANTVDAVGRVAVYPEERTDVSFPDTMMRVTLIDAVSAEFAAAVITSSHGRAHMRRSAAGSATSMVKINRASLGRMEFPLAESDAQGVVLAKLEQLDRGLEAVDAELTCLDSLSSSVLLDVFGGADAAVR